MEIKVKVWIEDDHKNLVFGSGKREILKYIDETGSISKAASKVGMSYKKTWTHIQILENYIEDKLVVTKKGRGEDSGTRLTPKAKELIELYNLLNEDIKRYSQERFKELFLNKKDELINLKEDDAS